MNADSDLSHPKPTLLNLFDTYYSPLQDGLRPIMKSFILALLPGLEEETGEFFDKVLVTLTVIRFSSPILQSGPCSLGSPVGHCLPVFLSSEHLAHHVDFTFCSRNVNKLSITTITTPESQRRYPFSVILTTSVSELTWKPVRYCSHRWT